MGSAAPGRRVGSRPRLHEPLAGENASGARRGRFADPAAVARHGADLEDGAAALALGFPAGGPYEATPARVQARGELLISDIYGREDSTVDIYQLNADIEPGNSGGPLVTEDGGQLRDFVHVRDVAAANLLALSGDATGAYNVASGTPRSVGEMARALHAATGGTAPAPQVTGAWRAGDVRHVFASTDRIARELGALRTLADELEAKAATRR